MQGLAIESGRYDGKTPVVIVEDANGKGVRVIDYCVPFGSVTLSGIRLEIFASFAMLRTLSSAFPPVRAHLYRLPVSSVSASTVRGALLMLTILGQPANARRFLRRSDATQLLEDRRPGHGRPDLAASAASRGGRRNRKVAQGGDQDLPSGKSTAPDFLGHEARGATGNPRRSFADQNECLEWTAELLSAVGQHGRLFVVLRSIVGATAITIVRPPDRP